MTASQGHQHPSSGRWPRPGETRIHRCRNPIASGGRPAA